MVYFRALGWNSSKLDSCPNVPPLVGRCRTSLVKFFLRQSAVWTSLLVFTTLILSGSVCALDPKKLIDQYGHDVWTSQNGLPGEAVYQILQTPDGYLWLRTSAGLVRFDGVRFVLTALVVANQTIDEPVKAICRGADGDLLVRTTSRTLIYKNAAFTDYRPPAPLPDGDIRLLFESRQHEVFVGSDDFIYLIQQDGVKTLGRDTSWVTAFLEYPDKLLVGSVGSHPIYSFAHGALSQPTTKLPNVTALASETVSIVWVGTENGLYQTDLNENTVKTVARGKIGGEVDALIKTSDGGLWAGTASGLFRISRG